MNTSVKSQDLRVHERNPISTKSDATKVAKEKVYTTLLYTSRPPY